MNFTLLRYFEALQPKAILSSIISSPTADS